VNGLRHGLAKAFFHLVIMGLFRRRYF